MFSSLIQKVFGSANERLVRKLAPVIESINALEKHVASLTDEQLQARTPWLKKRLEGGETLDDILPDAFATVREASKRVLGMRHFDVQLKGGIILHRGIIAEMKTGEGKTLVATLPVYLNALSGKGVHVVTVNDYLAQRDSDWMGRIYKFLGLSVGCIVHGLTDEERKENYDADITYGTNNEFGFDYLRDNMKFQLESMCQRPFNYAIVDEVDSILVDEARTPLIISGPAEDSSDLYRTTNLLIPLLKEEDYEKDEKARSVTLTEKGMEHIEEIVKEQGLVKGDKLYDVQNIALVHHINQALKAHKIFVRDVDYIINEGKIVIIDEFTGRMMEGRRYSDGLHQAIEAKEGVNIEVENQTLASITFQNYFRLYPKLAGMTGTAMTEASEFGDIYRLDVVEIPTHVPVQRKDLDDEVYRTFEEKVEAVVKLIQECRARNQPILVGTVSIEKSEIFSACLKKHKIPHQVLNARHHDKEAMIIAEAGGLGAVTIATNMAGRGTDIKLGGNLEVRLQKELRGIEDSEKRAALEKKIREEIETQEKLVKEAGGLCVIGTERHESRRIDNQLRGRSGRQGDPGMSKFFLSLEDDLMRIFGSERLDGWLQKLGMKPGEAITHPWINRALEKAQQKVEARNYDIRKHLLRYDDVMNAQRKAIYEQRLEFMQQGDLQEAVFHMRDSVVERMLQRCIPEGSYPEQWDAHGMYEEALRIFSLGLPFKDWAEEEGITRELVHTRLQEILQDHMARKEEIYTSEAMRLTEKGILLRTLDHLWKDHLHSLDHLRQGVHLRAYAQRDPLNEYKQEAFGMFEDMLDCLQENVTLFLCHFEPNSGQSQPSLGDFFQDYLGRSGQGRLVFQRDAAAFGGDSEGNVLVSLSPEEQEGLSRNAPCPCGSGKRFKNCHGQL
ncbi:MAG: preprotein translocase subunit SecA [Alphaproteobacteria bacterium]